MCRVLFSGPRVNIVLRLCRLSRLDHPLQEAVDVSSENRIGKHRFRKEILSLHVLQP